MGEDRTEPQSGHRVSVDEAARRLGLTVDAVRKRVQRNQLAYEKDAAGRVRIILDESETLQDDGPDTARRSSRASDHLVDELRDRLRYVERQLEEEREANRENRRLLAALIQRVPELEAPSPERPPEGSASASEEPDGTRPRPDTRGAPEQTSRVPWWRRMFGA